MTVVAVFHPKDDCFLVRVAAERLDDFLRVWKALNRA